MEKEQNTEGKILDAAKKVFVRKGYSGSSMQAIANEAGINKALLHYYFRSKDRLFQATFFDIFQNFVPKAIDILQSEESFEKKIEAFVRSYIELLMQNPLIPIFVLQELNRDPESLAKTFKSSGIDPTFFIGPIEKELLQRNTGIEDPKQFLVNLLGLCIFPIAARPLFQGIFFNNDQEDYQHFLEERKTEVSKFIINAITKK